MATSSWQIFRSTSGDPLESENPLGLGVGQRQLGASFSDSEDVTVTRLLSTFDNPLLANTCEGTLVKNVALVKASEVRVPSRTKPVGCQHKLATIFLST